MSSAETGSLLDRVEALEHAVSAIIDQLAMSPHSKAHTPWCLALIDSPAASQLMGTVRGWIDWVIGEYPVRWRDWPPCWEAHTEARQEVIALYLAWHKAYVHAHQPNDDPIYWHDRWMPGFLDRTIGPRGVLRPCISLRSHRDLDTPAAIGSSFDQGSITGPAAIRRLETQVMS